MPAALLNDFSLLRFSGPDTQAFLQGQLTCDVQALQTGTSTYGGYCTPKGRLLATFLLWRDDAAHGHVEIGQGPQVLHVLDLRPSWQDGLQTHPHRSYT